MRPPARRQPLGVNATRDEVRPCKAELMPRINSHAFRTNLRTVASVLGSELYAAPHARWDVTQGSPPRAAPPFASRERPETSPRLAAAPWRASQARHSQLSP